MHRVLKRVLIAVSSLALLAGVIAQGATPASATANPINHVIVILQENHSFDNVLGQYCVAQAAGNITRSGLNNACDGIDTTTTLGTNVQLTTTPDVVPIMGHGVTDQTSSICATCTNEVQVLTETGTTGGTFKVTFGGQTTGALQWQVTHANLQTALEGLSSIGTGNVAVTGSKPVFTLAFQGALARTNVAQVTTDSSLLTPAGALITPSTTTAGGAFQMSGFQAGITSPTIPSCVNATHNVPGGGSPVCTHEVQSITESGTPTSGNFTLGVALGTRGAEYTDNIAYNATAAQVQSTLNAVHAVGPGGVVATGGPLPSAVTVTFQDEVNETQMLVSINGVTGGTPSVSTTTNGTQTCGDDGAGNACSPDYPLGYVGCNTSGTINQNVCLSQVQSGRYKSALGTSGTLSPGAPLLTALASSFALSDRTFSDSASPSWAGHLEFAASTIDGFYGNNPQYQSTYKYSGGTLHAAITSTTATSITVDESSKPPAVPFTTTVDSEDMRVTARTGAANPRTYTVTRGYNSTTKATHLINTPEVVSWPIPAQGNGWGCDSNMQAQFTNATTWAPSCIPDTALNATTYPYAGAFAPSGVTANVPTMMDRFPCCAHTMRIYGGQVTLGAKSTGNWDICPSFASCLDTTQNTDLYPFPANTDTNVPPILCDAAGIGDGAKYTGPNPTDPANPYVNATCGVGTSGTLPSFGIVIPGPGLSQHNGTSFIAGDNWVGGVVAALRAGPYWHNGTTDNTAVFVVYDDCGCFYDHVNPAAYTNTNSVPMSGIRVPVVIASPYAKAGYTDSTPASFASILAYVEADYGLTPLNAADQYAYNFSNAFDYTQTPLTSPVHLKLDPVPKASLRYIVQHPTQAAAVENDDT